MNETAYEERISKEAKINTLLNNIDKQNRYEILNGILSDIYAAYALGPQVSIEVAMTRPLYNALIEVGYIEQKGSYNDKTKAFNVSSNLYGYPVHILAESERGYRYWVSVKMRDILKDLGIKDG